MNEFTTFLQQNPWILALLCIAGGYLIGSLSFARIIYYLATGKKKIDGFAEPIPHSDLKFESDLVSATLVSKKLGAGYGCLTSIADILKVAIPVLLVKWWLPENPWFLLVAFFGVLGHIYPLYHNFTGGRGESPILGALLVINWVGLIVSYLVSSLLGFLSGSILVVRYGGYLIMIFWLAYYFRDARYVIFMVLLNFLFWFSMRKDFAQFQALKKEKGMEFSEEDVSGFILMGRHTGRFLDRYSPYAWWKRRKERKGSEE